MKLQNPQLSNYLNSLQTRGRYTFTRDEALATLGITPTSFRFSALRLIKKKRLIRPKQGFYVIVPTEYSEVGTPPATWFIDTLMKFYQQPYYVGLLSAAALYGAAHQQPQVFQVVTNKPLRPVATSLSQIQFFTKRTITASSYQTMKTPTGFMHVSLPEITAFDLVRYVKSAGYFSHIATILSELMESFDEKRFKQILATEKLEPPEIQRLGYLLEIVEAQPGIILLLKDWVKEHKPRTVPLRPDRTHENSSKTADWNLYINEQIETDL